VIGTRAAPSYSAMNTNTTSTLRGEHNGASLARMIQIALGAWLFISAFIWPHTTAQMTNSWICGAIAVVFAAIAIRAPQARYVNTAVSVWLFISTFALPRMSVGTTWNNILVAIAMFIVSVAPSDWQPSSLRHAT